MEKKSYKLFRFNTNKITNIEIPEYHYEDEDYYLFVKKNSDNGRIQVIVSSDLMIHLLKYYFYDRCGTILSINLVEEDDDFHLAINEALELIKDNRDAFSLLLDRLYFLRNENSIDIQDFLVRIPSEPEPIFVTIQSNGVIHIEANSSSNEANNLKEIVRVFYENI